MVGSALMCVLAEAWAGVGVMEPVTQSEPVAAADRYTINISESVLDALEKQDVEAFLTSVYAPLNIRPEFVYYPSMRGLELVDKGQLDADGSRFEAVVKGYDNLLKVHYPSARVSATLFCLSESRCELSDRGLRTGVLNGFVMAKQMCESQGLGCYFTNSNDGLASLLDGGRLDALLVQTYLAPSLICQMTPEVFYWREIEAFSLPNFHYVHRSNQHLIDKLAASFEQHQKSQVLLNLLGQWKTKIAQCGKRLEALPPS